MGIEKVHAPLEELGVPAVVVVQQRHVGRRRPANEAGHVARHAEVTAVDVVRDARIVEIRRKQAAHSGDPALCSAITSRQSVKVCARMDSMASSIHGELPRVGTPISTRASGGRSETKAAG